MLVGVACSDGDTDSGGGPSNDAAATSQLSPGDAGTAGAHTGRADGAVATLAMGRADAGPDDGTEVDASDGPVATQAASQADAGPDAAADSESDAGLHPLPSRDPDGAADAADASRGDTGLVGGADASEEGQHADPDAGSPLAMLDVVVESTRGGSGRVLSDSSIDCGSVCSEVVEVGVLVTLSATADMGSNFVGFVSSDGECPATGDCTLQVNSDTAVTATFDGGPPMATLEVVVASTRGGSGSVSSTEGIDCGSACSEVLEVGQQVTLTATPDMGSDFVGFVSSGGACPVTGDCTLILAADTTVTATFDGGPPMATLDVVVASTRGGSGSVSSTEGINCGSACSEVLEIGTEVTLTAIPSIGSDFLGFASSDGVCPATGACTLKLAADTIVTATFDGGPPLVNLSVNLESVRGGSGSVSSTEGIDCGPTCNEVLAVGTQVTLTATADMGSDFLGFISSDGACPAMGACTLIVNADTAVTATFGGPPMYSVNAEIAGTRGGSGRVVSSGSLSCGAACTEMVAEGTLITFTGVADAGSQFNGFETSVGNCPASGDCTLTVTADTTVTGNFSANPIVTLSATDRDLDIRLRFDNLGADLHEGFGGVRSTTGIPPGSGVYYFEARRLTDRLGAYGVAVASDAQNLDGIFCGETDQSFGISSEGVINYDSALQGTFAGNETDHYGFVVDYRGATPTIYLLVHDNDPSFSEIVPQIRLVQSLPNVTTDLHFMVCGLRAIVGSEIEVNPGNDTTNFPFQYNVDDLLRAAGHVDVADALVLGWGQTYAGPTDAPPVVTGSMDITLSPGETANLSAAALDAEDGAIDVQWELLTSGYYLSRVTGAGPTFSFTPADIGLHQVRAWVADSIGQVGELIINVTVIGAVTQHDPVVLVPDPLTGAGIELSPDSLAARWTGFGKMGIRANQAIYGEFWYFEFSRLVAPVNMGGGLVVNYGNLNPYDWSDVPQSMSVNVVAGSWQNLISQDSNLGDVFANSTYGLAVDYRAATPTVYVITGDGVVDVVDLYDVTTPLYPMIYGNPTSLTFPGEYDEVINFGATGFVHDAAAALSAAGLDITAFEAGWGDANSP